MHQELSRQIRIKIKSPRPWISIELQVNLLPYIPIVSAMFHFYSPEVNESQSLPGRVSMANMTKVFRSGVRKAKDTPVTAKFRTFSLTIRYEGWVCLDSVAVEREGRSYL